MTLQTDDLAAFLAVAREGSFGRAASALLVSQPAVSERMAGLERDLGTTLFVRGARGTTLTAAGEQLVPYANRTVELLREAADSVRAFDDAPRLRVAVHVTFAHRVVPLLLDALGDLHRCVKLRDAHSEEIVAMLLDGVADVGFVVPTARPAPLTFIAMPADPVIGVCGPDHPLARRRVTMADLAQGDHRVAFNRFGTGAESLLSRLNESGVPEWRWIECSDAHTALQLARTQDHLAFVPASLAAAGLSSGVLARLDLRPPVKWSMPLVLAHRKSDKGDAAVKAIAGAVHRLHSSRHN
jgi:DNA-binding transcriptional LysR family regulator